MTEPARDAYELIQRGRFKRILAVSSANHGSQDWATVPENLRSPVHIPGWLYEAIWLSRSCTLHLIGGGEGIASVWHCRRKHFLFLFFCCPPEIVFIRERSVEAGSAVRSTRSSHMRNVSRLLDEHICSLGRRRQRLNHVQQETSRRRQKVDAQNSRCEEGQRDAFQTSQDCSRYVSSPSANNARRIIFILSIFFSPRTTLRPSGTHNGDFSLWIFSLATLV